MITPCQIVEILPNCSNLLLKEDDPKHQHKLNQWRQKHSRQHTHATAGAARDLPREDRNSSCKLQKGQKMGVGAPRKVAQVN